MTTFKEIAWECRKDADYINSRILDESHKNDNCDWESDSMLGEMVNFIFVRECNGKAGGKYADYINSVIDRFRGENEKIDFNKTLYGINE